MKGYKGFIIAFTLLLAVYIIAEMNRPEPVDWNVTLSRTDKNPYGGYILFQQLKDLFPKAVIGTYREPVYNQVNDFDGSNTAYFLIGPQINMSGEDVEELLDYVVSGNYVFMSSENFSKPLMDSLRFKMKRRFYTKNSDSSSVNFVNPLLHEPDDFSFEKTTMDDYINKIDTANSVVLGTNQLNDINFMKMPYGEGAFFIHALPLCFSNYFMLREGNANYAAKALSYLPQNISQVFWDEYYKLGPEGDQTPLRFILNNTALRWAFRIGLAAMVLFVLFGVKRKQRIIPVITPMANSTLEFVQTVGNVYFNKRDNKNIALKKINYFLEHVRSEYFLLTSHLNEDFISNLSKKSGVSEENINELIQLFNEVNDSPSVRDEILLRLNRLIDDFYRRS